MGYNIICGDNLETLDNVKDNSVQLVYIDPPYNTLGNQNKYNDKFDSDDEWLAMIEPRLVKSYNKLLPSGVIAVSIDDSNQAILKVLMDKLFGRNNFIATLIWIKAASQQTTKTFIKKHEYIITFAKDKKQLKMNRKLSEVEDDKRYKYKDEKETFWIMPDGSVSFINPNISVDKIEDNLFHDNEVATLSVGRVGNIDPIEVIDNEHLLLGAAHSSLSHGLLMRGVGIRDPIEVQDNKYSDYLSNMKAQVSIGRQHTPCRNKDPIEITDNQHYHDTLTLSATSQSECRIIGKNDPIKVEDNTFSDKTLNIEGNRNGDINPIKIIDNQYKTEALKKNGGRVGNNIDPITDNTWMENRATKAADYIGNKTPIEQPQELPIGDIIKLQFIEDYLDNTRHYIYIHQNKLNNKVYIGYTKQPHIRWRDTKRGAFDPNFEFYNQPLYNAIRRDGWYNFEHYVIEVFDDKEDALEAEMFWIEFFQSNRKVFGPDYGYNMHEGGSCPPSQLGAIPHNKGKKTPKESIEKMKKSKTNPSDEIRQNISNGGRMFNDKMRSELMAEFKELTYIQHKSLCDAYKELAIKHNCSQTTIYRSLFNINRIKKKLLIPVNEITLQLPALVHCRTAWRWCQKKIKWAQENNIVGYKRNKKGDWVAYFKQYKYLTTTKDKSGNYSLIPIIRTSPYETVLKDIAPDRVLSKLFGVKNTFHYAKPVALMHRLLEIFTSKDDTVLDVFAGSGTMVQAAFEYNRECIGLQNNENNIFNEVLIPRLNATIGTNFKILKI